MLERILNFSIHHRYLIVMLTVLAAAVGVWSLNRLPIDAVPDITNNQIQINTPFAALSPVEVEKQITFPVETAPAGIPGLQSTRSLSRNGFSQVTAIFEDDVDIYFARQQVNERLGEAKESLPPGAEPTMGPISTGLGEVFMYTVEYEHPHGEGAAVADGQPGWQPDGSYLTPEGQRLKTEVELASYLRTVQDWIIRPQLKGVKDVAGVDSIGGYVKQYHVTPDPMKLISYGLTFGDVIEALEKNNVSTGAGFIERNGEAYNVRAAGRIENAEQIDEIVLGTRNGVPIYVRDVASVGVGPELRTGSASENGEEVVVGTALMLIGANSRTVAANVATKIDEIARSLPPDVRAKPVLNRTKLVDATIRTVSINLAEGAILVIVVLFVLLGNFRAAFLTALAIPLSMLMTATGMVQGRISGNLMSLGAIDFGLIVDGAVIIVENCLRRLGAKQHELGRTLTLPERLHEVMVAAREMVRPSVFGQAIIITVYLPILALTGVEGKMFQPMALTVILALAAAFVLSLTFVPAMVALLIRGRVKETENWLVRIVKRAYEPTVRHAVRLRWMVVSVALVLFIASLLLLKRLGQEFVPTLDERDVAMHAMRIASTGIDQSTEMQRHVERAVSELPEVAFVFSKTGTAEVASDPMPPNVSDTFIILKDQSEWRSDAEMDQRIATLEAEGEELAAHEHGEEHAHDHGPAPTGRKGKLVRLIELTVKLLPGNNYEFTQPIQMRFNELISGVRSDVAVKVYGDDFEQMKRTAAQIAQAIESVAGAADVKVEQTEGLPMMNVEIDRSAIARYGLSVADVQDVVAVAVGGREAGQVFEGDRRFDLVVRLPEAVRSNLAELEDLPIPLPPDDHAAAPAVASADPASGPAAVAPAFIPLSSVAQIVVAEGPNQVSRENGKRRIVVQANVRGRDIGSFVEDARRQIDEQVKIPAGSWLDWGGQFENLLNARQRLMVVVPICFLLIFLLLFSTFNSVKYAVMVFTGVPLALTGGIAALWLRDMPFSISAAVGFIALSGVAVLNGLVMVTFINQLRQEGADLDDAILRGSLTRLRPVLMTALVASLGFVPMAIATGTGAEVQKPLATVVIGGIVSSTVLTLVVLPALYRIWHRLDRNAQKLKSRTTDLRGLRFEGRALYPVAMRLLRTALTFALIAHCACSVLPGGPQTDDAGSKSPPLRILFLGDQGHHKPAERAAQLLPYLSGRGMDARYSEDQNELSPQKLADVDVVLIYANDESITPEQENALLEFINGGGGFVPVHCASYCYHNSPKYVELVGAQFKSHGGEVFKAKITEPNHPAMLGLDEFSSWDETYVHHRHNPDRQVLMMRDQEPYTWTREVGKGRVFYTALGHDERTWGEMGFLRLIENGIRWAAKRESSIPAVTRTVLPPLKYVTASSPIPFYPPSDKWGVQAEPLKEMQAPLPAEQSLKYLELPDGFRAELFAAEPDIVKVIAMTWDERGRLWIAETLDYPNDQQRRGEGNDRIKICEDTDHDGKADKFTVFADKLSIPTSLCFANGGLIVTEQPDTLFFQDTDGDDKADVCKVLFTGWGTKDTHAGPSNLRYGFDNWVWGTVGYSGFDGKVGDKSIRFGQGIFRFKPDGSALEFLSSTSNNTWGLGFSETGQVFASTANNDHSVHLAIPNRYYESVRGWHGLGSGGIAQSERYYPITEHHRQMDWHGKFTAAAGHALYTARAFPKWYWNRVSFVTEGTGHLIHNDVLEPAGSGYVARNAYNFLASRDEWTSPVTAEVGPDGAVWVSDWYNYIFQHNPTPNGFKTGKGNAYETPLRDKTHGRVYRIVYGSRKPEVNVKPTSADELVALLGGDNLFWRLTAQRLLVQRGNRDVVPALEKLTVDVKLDGIGNAPQVVHALGTLKGLDALPANVALAGLKHPAAAVRKAALDVCPRDAEMTRAILSAGLLADSDAQVRLSALLALSEMPSNDAAGEAVVAAMRQPDNARDRWIPEAATAAAARHDAGFLTAALSSAREAGSAKPRGAAINLIANGSFEELSGAMPTGWQVRNWQGSAEAAVEDGDAVAGQRSLRLTADKDAGADSSASLAIKVEPNTNYRLSARVRTRGVNKGGGLGALVNVHEIQAPRRAATNAVVGTKDWTLVQTSFNSGERKQITVNCLLGGWGKARGTAWFDDVRLEPVAEGAAAMQTMLRVVAAHYAQGAPLETLPTILRDVNGADEATTTAVLDGLVAGWPADAALAANPQADEELLALARSFSADNRARLATLAQKLGRGALFAEEVTAARKELLATLADESTPTAARLDTARRLLALGDTPENVEAILKLVTPQSTPALAAGLTSSLAESSQDATGAALLAKWKTLPPAARKAGVNVLMRRAAWHRALLDAMEKGTVSRADLSAEQAQQLVTMAGDAAAGERAKKLLAAGRLPDAEKQKVIDKLMAAAAGKRGDVAAGKVSFEKNCAVCHVFAGAGGRVGPDLTGIGKNPRPEILLNIIDPNRSVEGNFRLWIVQTKGGETIAGRLDTESQTTVELLDSAGKQQVVQRKNIRRMVAQPTSIMPEGFELLPEKELVDLVEFLAQPVGSGP